MERGSSADGDVPGCRKRHGRGQGGRARAAPKARQTKKCCCGQHWCPTNANAAFNVPAGEVTRVSWAHALNVRGLIFGKEYRVCTHHFNYEDFEVSSAKERDGGSPNVRLRRGVIPSVDETAYRSALKTSVEDCFRWRALAENLLIEDGSDRKTMESASSFPKDLESTSVLSVETLNAMEQKHSGCVLTLTGFPDFRSLEVIIPISLVISS